MGVLDGLEMVSLAGGVAGLCGSFAPRSLVRANRSDVAVSVLSAMPGRFGLGRSNDHSKTNVSYRQQALRDLLKRLERKEARSICVMCVHVNRRVKAGNTA